MPLDTSTLGGLLGVVSAAATTIVLLLCADYVMSGIGYMRIAARRDIKNAWLIWIPVARNWTIGTVAEKYDETRGIKRNFKIFLVIFSLIRIAILVAVGSYISMLAPYFIKYGIELFTYDLGNLALLVPVGVALVGILIASVIYKAFYTVSLYKTFESTDTKNSLVYAIISSVIPFAAGLFVLLSREKGYSAEDLVEEKVTEEAEEKEQYFNSIEEISFDE